MKRKRLLLFAALIPIIGLVWALKSAASWRPQVIAIEKSKETESSALWLSAQGQLLVVDSLDNTDGFAVWDVTTRQLLWNRSNDSSLEISPDERILALVGATHPIRREVKKLSGVRFELHDARTGHLLRMLKAQPDFEPVERFLKAGFLPDSREFLVATSSRLRRWDVSTGRLLFDQKLQSANTSGTFSSVAFVPGQPRFVGFDDAFAVFDARTGQQLQRFPLLRSAPEDTLEVAPDGFSFCENLAGGSTRVFRLSDGQELWHASSFPTFSADGKLAYVPNSTGIHVLDAHTGHQLRSLPGPQERYGWPPMFAPSPDRNWLYEARNGKIWRWRAR